ncbi:carbon-nitrogen hydrolase family protein [Candidatus Gracilibacteria bacterium]|nr:carbon-nitrogen hydrolase family protein [Candidatus Gracilibacteria bacterium]
MKTTIGVVQFEAKQFCPEDNMKRAEAFVRKAARRKAQVVVFPEDFLTGPICGQVEYVDFKHQYRDLFIAWSIRYHIDIVAGSVIEGDHKGWYNTCYYIDAKGTIKGCYRKVNLWLGERHYLTPGNQVKVFDTAYGKVGLVICWDLAFPEIFRKMVQQGVEVVFCPSYWTYQDAGVGLKYDPNSEAIFVNALATARAFENQIVLVYANAAGKFEIPEFQINAKLIGQSQITTPFQGAIQRLEDNNEGMFLQEVDLDVLKDAETSYAIRADLRERVL